MEASYSRFTAAEGGARLAAATSRANILAVEYASFISTRLVYEEAYKIRGSMCDGCQRSVYVTRPSRVKFVAFELNILTDLSIAQGIEYSDVDDWCAELDEKEVLVCTSSVLRLILQEEVLAMKRINVLVLDSCHLVCKDENLQYIMKFYEECDINKRPRILALTYPLFALTKKASKENIESNALVNNSSSSSENISENVENLVNNVEKYEIFGKKQKADDDIEICGAKNETELNLVHKIHKNKGHVNNFQEMGIYKNLDDFEMYEKLEWKIQELEKTLFCQMDLAEDIDGGKRLSASLTKPKELIIEYNDRTFSESLPEPYIQLEKYMRDTVNDAMDFLIEHRYDPSEIYGEDLYEDFMNIPDPTLEPKYIFKQFLYVLDQLGPYAADKAAFSLLTKLEKLKIKVPYERHFLLLCLCSTVFVTIRCHTDSVFSNYASDWEKIKLFCTPKVLRFAEILEKFDPNAQEGSPKGVEGPTSKNNNEKKSSKIHELLNEINKCDFNTLGNKIEDRVNTYEANLKDLDNETLTKAEDNKNSAHNETNKDFFPGNPETDMKSSDLLQKGVLGFSRRSGHRARARGRIQRNNAARVQQMQQNPNALCGIVFMKEALMAKIMFLLIVDMSRSYSKLSYLCAQYCAVENPANPGTEPKECQRQGKKQEDVLKKFRMHECNLLLATSALEEGIDLPRCNLVLRWDVPPSYRSYGLCRGRARAPRAACVLMSCGIGHNTEDLLQNLATYRELDQIISRKCGCGIQDEPPQSEEDHAETFTTLIKAYTPNDSNNIKNNKINESLKTSDDILQISKDIKTEKKKENKDKDINKEKDKLNRIDEIGNTNNAYNKTSELLDEKHEKAEKTDLNILNIVKSNGSCDSDKKVNDERNNGDNKPKLNDIKEIVCENESCDKNICDSINKNLTCNKCNSERNSQDVECPCVVNLERQIVDTESKTVINKIDCKVQLDSSENIATVDLSTAIALINRYCGKLPSDTFTRLAPQWWMEEIYLPVRGTNETKAAYVCTLRLPLNCPVKYNIVGHPMPTRVLARRMVALQACRILHKSGELDNELMPIGKENFKAAELEAGGTMAGAGGDSSDPSDLARPGTTKRRQYYFKRTAWAFTDCQPVVDTSDSEIDPNEVNKPTNVAPESGEVKKGKKRNMLYAIVSSLWCALPERYNTRGRRLHAPQSATQAIGILMARDEPDNLQIPAFPVYTRSGEVRVSVEHVPDADIRMSPRRGRLVRRFMRFVFAEVLRVRRRGMKLQNDGSTHNNYYIVPTIKSTRKDGTLKIDIDWPFLELIYQHTEQKKNSEIEKPILWHPENDEDDEEDSPVENKVDGKEKNEGVEKKEPVKMDNPLLKPDETFVFDQDKYKEAVVTPWYRNQDQPQFFLVAEICWNLSPDSAFPSATHTSFRNYYSSKYGVVLTQSNQPLLDVDHTSARLNLLTPRYVNRKGVALPVSSERTRRAKRDRLDQKQILVPELCRVHPFAAPLWFATVALPCVLYRINALLIADEIRRAVAIDVGLGIPKIDEKTRPDFQWPALDFGWSLAEVLNVDPEKKKEGDSSEKKGENDKEISKEYEEEETTNKKETECDKDEPKEKTINDILQEKEDAEAAGFEIGTWSNDMASSIPQTMEYDEYMEPLPPNLTFCTSASGGTNWCDAIEKPKSHFNPTRTFSVADSDCSYMSSDFDTDDSDLNSDSSDEDTDLSGFCSSKNSNVAMGVRIEYKTAHEAEAVDVERKKKVNPAPQPDEEDDMRDREQYDEFIKSGNAPEENINKFRKSVDDHKKDIIEKGYLIPKDKVITDILPELTREIQEKPKKTDSEIEEIAEKLSKVDFEVDEDMKVLFEEVFPYGSEENLKVFDKGSIILENIEKSKRILLSNLKKSLPVEELKKLNCFSMVDVDIDSPNYVNEKVVNVGFDTEDIYTERITNCESSKEFKPYYEDGKSENRKEFDFDYQPKLEGHPGPSPSLILQALTMSNANDGINLERLETIGDSFLKFAITAYLYCAHPTVHEGKLSHMRSKQVSNLNLYRLGRNKRLGARMIASKFEPHDNWLPPCHKPPPTLHPRLAGDQNQDQSIQNPDGPIDSSGCFIPYNLITQHSIPDKSIADCVEALIGAYLLECGPRGALLFMSWLGIRVLPKHLLPLPTDHPYVMAADTGGDELVVTKLPPVASPKRAERDTTDSDSECSSDDEEEPWQEHQEQFPETDWSWPGRPVGSLRPYRDENGKWVQPIFGELKAPPSPLLRYIEDPEGELEQMLSGYDALEKTLQYRFKDRSLLLQALTHASHQKNRLTDCYQRLEFLGDAILDYLITRHLYEDPRRHSPGALTDLRSALVNNTIFATLAARHGFHKYFRHMSPGLNEVLTKYVRIQEENGHSISEEHYLIQEDEMEQAEDVEVPKALGDLFESVAGAIFLDSGMSLGAVWKSYVNLMGAELEAFSAAAPKSPVRELLEAEPDTAKFGKPERLADGRRVRVCVEVFGRGAFKGVGRNYRIAKGTAARCALRHLRRHRPH